MNESAQKMSLEMLTHDELLDLARRQWNRIEELEKKDEYSGWSNYETWHTMLCIDNEQGSYNYWREVAADIIREAKPREFWDRKQTAVFTLEDRLKEEHEEAFDEYLENAPYWIKGVARGGFDEVDWREMAEGMIEDMWDAVSAESADEEEEEENE